MYVAPGADAVEVRRDVAFRGGGGGVLAMDLYYPPKRTGPIPAVVMVEGYNDVGFARMLGSRFKDMPSTVDWCRSIAASGLAAVAYTNTEPVADATAVLAYLRANAAALELDAHRIGLWACSGHGPLALSLLMSDAGAWLRCAALLYPFTMDLDGSTAVAEAAKLFRFATPAEGKAIDDLPSQVALLIARAGKDEMPRLNEALDRFVSSARARPMPFTVLNHPEGPHAFDLMDDSERSREIIDATLSFLRHHLTGEPS